MSEEAKKDYIGICFFCNEKVDRSQMTYQRGKVFHLDCYEKHEKEITLPNPGLASKSAITRVELVKLKNLQVRQALPKANPGKKSHNSKRKANPKRKKPAKRKKPSRPKKRSKSKAKKPNKSKSRKKTKTRSKRTSRKKSTRKKSRRR